MLVKRLVKLPLRQNVESECKEDGGVTPKPPDIPHGVSRGVFYQKENHMSKNNIPVLSRRVVMVKLCWVLVKRIKYTGDDFITEHVHHTDGRVEHYRTKAQATKAKRKMDAYCKTVGTYKAGKFQPRRVRVAYELV